MKILAPRDTWYLPPEKGSDDHPSDYHHPYCATLYFTLIRWSLHPKLTPFRIYNFLRENRFMRWWAYSHGTQMDLDWEIFGWHIRTEIDKEVISLIMIEVEKMKKEKTP